jgi:hypothetical protein
MTDYAKKMFGTPLKAEKTAAYIKELITAACKGDSYALDFVFKCGAQLAYTSTFLAGDKTHTKAIRQIVQTMPCVAVTHSQIESWDKFEKSVYEKFEIGKEHRAIIRGRWDSRNPASKSIVDTIMIMASIRIRANEKPQSQWTEVERICGNLPSTRTKAQRLKACKEWRDAFIQFSNAWHQAGLCEDITTWPEFKHYLDRRGNRSSSPSVAGISEMILEFLKRHLKI